MRGNGTSLRETAVNPALKAESPRGRERQEAFLISDIHDNHDGRETFGCIVYIVNI